VISNDMREDERYKDLPFVQKKPNFRFYAGTPLTTDSNINVGCFFVLDTKPHVEFTQSEKETMGTMGMLIMDFLKVSRQASEGRRATRLSRGLSCFVEGRSRFADSSEDPITHNPNPQQISRPSSKTRSSHLSISNNQYSPRRSRSRGSDARSVSPLSDINTDYSRASSVGSHLSGLRSDNMQNEDKEYQGNAWTFQRAANLIRESLELEGDAGVVFVEGGNDTMFDFDTRGEVSGSLDNNKSATVLAISAGDAPLGPETGSITQFPVSGIDDGFLHGLLCRYGQGKIWSFHRDGLFSSSDSDESTDSSRKSRTGERTRSKRAKKWKTIENNMLNKYFPGATQVMFVPLWNTTDSQWFGGCFCWNNVENVVFDQQVELSSLLGFGSSIMAECNRIEAQISDRQKADFLGSVSHELRSPLHGILAAAELLHGTKFDDFQGSLLGTINACGRTLLDTMNQVLDYTKIVSLEKDLHHLKRNRASSVDLKSMQRSASQLDAYMPTDVSLLAEEVVEGVCLGHSYDQRPASSSTPVGTPPLNEGSPQSLDIPQLHVDVDMDIAQNDWVYYTPPGALRRIIMNIFSNAVKYTDSGRVSLRLEAREAPENWSQQHGTKKDMITLTVSDTGRGMSEEFLRGRLFIPFAQENSLAVGTGLGLSIVCNLLKSLGGNIAIDSRPGEGTTVKVTLPMARREPNSDGSSSALPPPLPEVDTESLSTEVRLLRDAHAGRTIAIMGVEPEDASTHPQWGAFSRYLTDWYGLKLVSCSSKAPIDVILASELPLKKDISWDSDSNQAVLVLSRKFVDHNTTQPEWSSANALTIVSRPYGPHKLSRFIHKCFDQAFSLPAAESVVLPERDRKFPPTPPEDASSDQPIPHADNTQRSTIDHIPPTPQPSHAILSPSSTPENTENAEPTTEPRKPRILVVEDNKINLNLMLAFLKRRKLDTLHSAENGQLAVDAVEQVQPGYDIIFMGTLYTYPLRECQTYILKSQIFPCPS
jgi:signal transduction histidine kinase